MCACVSTTASIELAGTGSDDQLRSRSCFRPWNRPQSTSSRRPSCSTRYFDPVTVPVPPTKRSCIVHLVRAVNAARVDPLFGARSRRGLTQLKGSRDARSEERIHSVDARHQQRLQQEAPAVG